MLRQLGGEEEEKEGEERGWKSLLELSDKLRAFTSICVGVTYKILRVLKQGFK